MLFGPASHAKLNEHRYVQLIGTKLVHLQNPPQYDECKQYSTNNGTEKCVRHNCDVDGRDNIHAQVPIKYFTLSCWHEKAGSSPKFEIQLSVYNMLHVCSLW